MAGMSDDHDQLAAELLALAESVLERLDPILQRAASPPPPADGIAGSPWSGCTWCPVCALAALVRGEQHDLVTLLAGHASAAIVVLREVLDEHCGHPDPAPHSEPDQAGSGVQTTDAADGAGPAFVPIVVTIKD